MSNVPFNNTLFSYGTIASMHPTMERLYQAAQALKGLTKPTEIGKLLDELPQTVNNWERRGISKGGAIKAQKFIGCDSDWLLTGEGDMQAGSSNVMTLGFATTANDTQGAYQVTAEPWDAGVVNIRQARTRGRVPLISWVQAGSWADVHDNHLPGEADHWVDAYASTPSPNAFALTVEGDSMTAPAGQSFPAGCMIIVDPHRSPKAGDYVVAKDVNTQRATFKKLTTDGGTWYLKPLNPDPVYKTIAIDDPGLRVIGVVIEWYHGGRL